MSSLLFHDIVKKQVNMIRKYKTGKDIEKTVHKCSFFQPMLVFELSRVDLASNLRALTQW